MNTLLKKKLSQNTPTAFTLIELLVVIAIIMILAGLVVGGAGFANRAGAENRARTEVRALELALQEYKLDNGEYPPLADVSNGILTTTPSAYLAASQNLYTALVLGAKKYFRDVPKAMVSGNGGPGSHFVDPWGNPYGWSKSTNPAHNPNTPEVSIWSLGAVPANTKAWITNFGSN